MDKSIETIASQCELAVSCVGRGLLSRCGERGVHGCSEASSRVGAVVTAEETLLKLYDLHKQMANMAKQNPQT